MGAIEETIREIAATHGVALGRDDPILILQTINSRLLQDGARSQQALLEQFRQELETLAQRWGSETQNQADRSLTAALRASTEAMTQAMNEGAEIAAQSMRAEIASGLAQVRQAGATARHLAVLNLAAAGMTLAAAVFAFWIVLGR